MNPQNTEKTLASGRQITLVITDPANFAARRRLDPELKTRWLAALRSGDYQQGPNRLCQGESPERYCCLGVFCELKELPRTWAAYGYWKYTIHGESRYADIGNLEPALGPLGTLPGCFVRTADARKRGSLSNLNDNGFTFAEIADIIEIVF